MPWCSDEGKAPNAELGPVLVLSWKPLFVVDLVSVPVIF
jgi:hypothetical protein